MRNRNLTLKIIGLLVFSDILETFSQFCFKKGALSINTLQASSLAQAFTFILGMFSSIYLWLGLFSVLLTFILWSSVLSKIDLSVAVPIASFSYILVPLTSIIFLHEKVDILRWMGIFLILVGVIAVSLSTKTGGEEIK